MADPPYARPGRTFNTPVEAGATPTGDAAARRRDEALGRRASTSLLGLVEPYALPPGQSYPKPADENGR